MHNRLVRYDNIIRTLLWALFSAFLVETATLTALASLWVWQTNIGLLDGLFWVFWSVIPVALLIAAMAVFWGDWQQRGLTYSGCSGTAGLLILAVVHFTAHAGCALAGGDADPSLFWESNWRFWALHDGPAYGVSTGRCWAAVNVIWAGVGYALLALWYWLVHRPRSFGDFGP